MEDSATDEEIKRRVDEVCNYDIYYKVEEGYKAYTKVCYYKNNPSTDIEKQD